MKFSLANRPIFPQKSNERSVYSCMLFAIVAKELIDINSKKGSNWSFTVQIAHNNKKIIVPRDERIKSLHLNYVFDLRGAWLMLVLPVSIVPKLHLFFNPFPSVFATK